MNEEEREMQIRTLTNIHDIGIMYIIRMSNFNPKAVQLPNLTVIHLMRWSRIRLQLCIVIQHLMRWARIRLQLCIGPLHFCLSYYCQGVTDRQTVHGSPYNIDECVCVCVTCMYYVVVAKVKASISRDINYTGKISHNPKNFVDNLKK